MFTNRCNPPFLYFALPILLGRLLSTSPAAAAAEDEAAARELFVRARQLMKEGQYAEACPKLEAAAKIVAGPGVLLNLGDCYAHVARLASAWTEFAEAEAAAARAGRSDVEAEARRRKGEIEPQLTRMRIRVARTVPSLEVRRDGTPIDPPAWGTAIPIDAGEHRVTASAPGFVAWSTVVAARAPGEEVVVDVPELQATPVSPVSTNAPASPTRRVHADVASPEPATAARGSTQRVVGVAGIGAGALTLGIGVALGFGARAADRRAEAETGGARHDDSERAVAQGNIATAVSVGGIAMAGAGAILV